MWFLYPNFTLWPSDSKSSRLYEAVFYPIFYAMDVGL